MPDQVQHIIKIENATENITNDEPLTLKNLNTHESSKILHVQHIKQEKCADDLKNNENVHHIEDDETMVVDERKIKVERDPLEVDSFTINDNAKTNVGDIFKENNIKIEEEILIDDECKIKLENDPLECNCSNDEEDLTHQICM